MDKIQADVLGFKIGNNFIACELACDISITAEAKPASVPNSGGWRGTIYGMRSWEASVSGNILKAVSPADESTLIDAILNRTVVQVEMATRDAKFRLYGNAVVVGVNIGSTQGELANFGGRFVGDGGITKVKI